MSNIIDEHFHYLTVQFNPMVSLNPKTYEAIYSTKPFLNEQSGLSGLCCEALTFDQPLYLKAEKKKQGNLEEVRSLHIQLDRFHQLMSF